MGLIALRAFCLFEAAQGILFEINQPLFTIHCSLFTIIYNVTGIPIYTSKIFRFRTKEYFDCM